MRISGELAAHVHAWSTGGYMGTSDEPMTHVALEIANPRRGPVVFDGDNATLAVFDANGAPLPPTRLVTITPLGPAKVVIAPGSTKQLDLYFLLPVRPRVVDSMRAQWTLTADGATATQTTSFVRDDSGPVESPPERPLPAASPAM